jgi:tetratricopeptide (TPR) repeat protein
VATPSLLAILLVLAADPRPRVDVSAMREAIEARSESYSSASAYAHFLRGRLFELSGEHARSADQLRLALASDPGRPELLLALAEAQAHAGDAARAEATVRSLLDRRPEYVPALVFLGRLLFDTDRPARAREVLARVRKLAPQEQEPYLLSAELALESGRTEEAVRAVQDLADTAHDTVGLKRLGLALIERGDPQTAIGLLDRAVALDPGDADALAAQGQALEALGKATAADAVYARALERDPDSREVLLRAGKLALRSGNDARARAYLDRLLSLGDDPETALQIALTWFSAQRIEAAVRVLEQSQKSRPDPRLSLALGLVQAKAGHWAAAARAYGEVPEGSPGWKDAIVQRALALAHLGQRQQAESTTTSALQRVPGDVTLEAGHAAVLQQLGETPRAESFLRARIRATGRTELVSALAQLFSRSGAHAQAISVLSDALRARPQDEDLLYELAAAYQRSGDTSQALASMRQVLALNPRNASALNFIGYTLADRGEQLDEAERLIRSALALQPNSGAYLDSLGWLQFRRGDYAHAADTLERAVELDPEEPTILEHLGDAYGGTRRRQEAAMAYRRALEAIRASDDPEAKGRRAPVERKLKALSSPVADR